MKITLKTLIFIISIVFFTSCGGSDKKETPEKRKSITEYEAKAVAEGQIETVLKSPSTAKYSGLRDTKITPIEFGYKVSGFVDSQNGFGAMMRSNYNIEVYVDTLNGNILYKNLSVK